MKCPVCQSEGMGYIMLRADETRAKTGMNYRKYTCSVCMTNFTVMYRIKDAPEALERLVASYNHIAAIKLQRSITGWGLKESKAYCDNLRDKLVKQGKMAGKPKSLSFRELAGRRLR